MIYKKVVERSQYWLYSLIYNQNLKQSTISINDFDLRRLFYFRQGFKDTCYFPVYTSYKETNSTELIDEKVYNTFTKGNISEVHQWALVQSNS